MFALLYQFWSYILSPETAWTQYGGRHFFLNQKFENYREISPNPGAFIKFYEAKQLFYNQSIEIYTTKNFSLQQLSFL